MVLLVAHLAGLFVVLAVFIQLMFIGVHRTGSVALRRLLLKLQYVILQSVTPEITTGDLEDDPMASRQRDRVLAKFPGRPDIRNARTAVVAKG